MEERMKSLCLKKAIQNYKFSAKLEVMFTYKDKHPYVSHYQILEFQLFKQ